MSRPKQARLTPALLLAHYCAAMKSFLRTYGPAIASGIFLALAFPSWGLFPLAWVALAPLFYQARRLTPRAVAGRFLLAGWVFNSVLLHWLMTNVYWAGGWAFIGYQILCVILALFWGGLGFLMAWMRTTNRRFDSPLVLFVLWPFMEFLQSRLFSGFGWGAIGYSQGKDLLVTQWASLGNVIAISAIVVLCNAFLAWFPVVEAPVADSNPKSKIQNPKSRLRLRFQYLVFAAAVVIAAHAGGSLMLGQPDYASKPLNAGIVQGNFPIEMKYDADYSEEMVRNAAQKSRWLAQHEKVDLFVWPEAMVMTELDKPGIRKEISEMIKDTGAALYTGACRQDEKTGGYPNTSYLIDKDDKVVDYYDKVHLVAFGEYVPFSEYLPFLQKVVPAIGEAMAGEKQKVLPVAGRTLGPLICFEVLFPNMSANLRAMGADVLVVITNLAWFGSSAAIPQEFELARMRAVETRLPLIHSSNTGISGVFDPWGRFEKVDAAFAADGRYFKFGDQYTAEETIMQRVAGALPVAAPAKVTPVPLFVPALFIVLSCILIAMATLCRVVGLKKR